MRVGAIDIGTNTFLCLIAEVEAGVVKEILSDEVEIVRIGEGVNKNRYFLPEALTRADECLARFQKRLVEHGVQKIDAVATSAARDVSNGPELISLGEKRGIPIRIIDGPEEARLTFSGVLTNAHFRTNIAVIDVGGGSTEITFENEEGQLEAVSVDLGGVRLTEMFVTGHPIAAKEIQKMREYSRNLLKRFPRLKSRELVAVAGTPTTLAALNEQIDYTRDTIEGYKLTVRDISTWIERLASMSLNERAALKGLEPKRADIIVAGAVILEESAKALGGESLWVSTRGVRYGVAAGLAK